MDFCHLFIHIMMVKDQLTCLNGMVQDLHK